MSQDPFMAFGAFRQAVPRFQRRDPDVVARAGGGEDRVTFRAKARGAGMAGAKAWTAKP